MRPNRSSSPNPGPSRPLIRVQYFSPSDWWALWGGDRYKQNVLVLPCGCVPLAAWSLQPSLVNVADAASFLHKNASAKQWVPVTVACVGDSITEGVPGLQFP